MCVGGLMWKNKGVTFENPLNVTVYLSVTIHIDTKTCTLNQSGQYQTDGIDADVAELTGDR